MRWCDDGVLVLSSVAPSLVLYSVAPSLVLYSVAPTHCLTLTIHCLTHTIFLSLTIRGNRLDALFRYPSNSFTHSSTLVIPHLITPMVSYYHQVFSHNLCSHSLSSLIHKCSHCSTTCSPNHPTSHHSFHQSPISWCPLLVLSSLSLIHKSSHMVSYHSSCYP